MRNVILTMAVLTIFLLTGFATASPPVPPPTEGFKITTDTYIVCIGSVTDSSNYTWHWNNGNADGIAVGPGGTLAEGESEARIRYTEEFNSNNTLSAATVPTTFDKKFVAATHSTDTPNLSVDTVIGYTSDGAAGSVADFDDKIAIEVVSAGGDQTGAFAVSYTHLRAHET